MAESFLLVLVLLVGLVAPLVLFMLIRAEHDEREALDRETAEQVARRDTRDEK